MKPIKQIFVNLPVKDLEKAKEFWGKIGFLFNPQFTDNNGAALVLGENIFAMLLQPTFMMRFTKKQIADATKTTEAINALSVSSREEVDQLIEKVKAAGGKEIRDKEDYGWMYGRSFEDIDGHQWELVCMDIAKAPATPNVSVPKPKFQEAQ